MIFSQNCDFEVWRREREPTNIHTHQWSGEREEELGGGGGGVCVCGRGREDGWRGGGEKGDLITYELHQISRRVSTCAGLYLR